MLFKKKILVLSILSAMTCTAYAEESSDDNDSEKIETIEVLGTYRGNIIKALDEKRFNKNLVEVILAEDIGKFPDLTTADALQRVSGVQVSRGSGEADGVVIRGLPNVQTTINGRSIFSTSGRSFAFQDLPAEAISGLEVYKSRSADQVEGGIAGLVNINLRKPFDFDGFKTAGSVRLTEDQYTDDIDPVISGLISNRWQIGNGEFGALVNVSKIEDHFQQSTTFASETLPSWNTPDGSLVGVPLSVGIVTDKGLRERQQLNFSLQYKPDENTEFYLDGMYAGLENKANTIFGIGFTAFEPLTNIMMNPSEDLCSDVDGQQACYVDSAIVHGTGFLAGTHAKTSSVDLAQTALGLKWNNSDNIFIKSEIVVTDSERQYENFIQDWWLDGNADVSFETNVNNHVNFDVANDKQLTTNYNPGGMFEPWDDSEGSELSWTLDVDYKLDGGFFNELQLGFRYADRDAEFIAGDRQSSGPVDLQGAKDYGQEYLAPVDMGGATYLDLKGHYAADSNFMLTHKAEIRALYGRGPGKPESDPLRNFNANEKSYSAYGQVIYGTEIAGLDLDGQVGVRVINTERTMSSFGTVDGIQTEFTETTDSTEVLPNISANFHFTEELMLRTSISRTISNPEFGDLNPNQFVFPPAPGTPTGSGSGGNPDLAPIESISSDLSLEYYPKDGGIASIAVFYRDIEGYISTFSEFKEIDGVGYNINRPFSSGTGNLEGVELSYSKFFTELPAPFNGLGVQLNYTYVDGEVSLPDGEGGNFDTELAGVSKDNGNVVFMYESGDIFSRLAYNYRGDYIDSFSTPGIQPEQTNNVRESGRVDASIGYNITENLTVVLDGSNLNDETFSNYWGHPDRPRDRRDPGRTISLSVTYQM